MRKSVMKKRNRKLIKKYNMLKKSVKKDILALRDDNLYGVFKREDFSFLESLIDSSNQIREICEGPLIEMPKDLKQLIAVQHEMFYNKMHTDSREEYFEGDILITDPCYVFKGIEEEKVKYISRDTIYGDWGCTTYETDTKKSLGKFCADSGMVAVISLDDVLKLKPNFDGYKNESAYTVIRGFKGYVKFIVKEIYFMYKGKKEKTYEVRVVGKGNINFFTTQTEL